MSVFISFEGGEGCGKTTQASLLRERLKQMGVPALLVREPGTTELGKDLRKLLKAPKKTYSYEAELLLFAAARAELVKEVIGPALKQGIIIIADRYADSSVAYQGYGRGLDIDLIRRVNQFVTQGVVPDLTVLLDIDPREGLQRLSTQQSRLPLEGNEAPEVGRMDDETQRKFEKEPLEFHRRVRSGYLKLAKAEGQRWLVVPASLPSNEIALIIWNRVKPLADQLHESRAAATPSGLPQLL